MAGRQSISRKLLLTTAHTRQYMIRNPRLLDTDEQEKLMRRFHSLSLALGFLVLSLGAGPNINAYLIPLQNSTDATVAYAGFTFVLKQCKISGGELVCLLSVTSNDEDRSIVVADPVLLYDKSRMVDNNGNEYRPRETIIGNKRDRADLVANVATRVTIKFSDINPETTKITLLRLLYSSSGRNESWAIEFRDIPIVGRTKELSKDELYAGFTANRTTNKSEAYRYANQYLKKTGGIEDDITHYLEQWVGQYEGKLPPPKLLSPEDWTVFEFDNPSRKTKVEWLPVAGASGYTVEIQFLDGKGWNDLGEHYSHYPAAGYSPPVKIKGTNFAFEWVGANKGRWRVWAIDSKGNEGVKSVWWEFRYRK
jgi:hypothetical protein